jgi:hypothetical protein
MTGKELRNTSVLGVRTPEGILFRFDRAHAGAEYNHLNVNPKFSGVKDPHYKLPPGSIPFGKAATNVIHYGGRVMLYTSVAMDAFKYVLFVLFGALSRLSRSVNDEISLYSP